MIKLFSQLLSQIGTFFTRVIGRVSWTRPAWLTHLAQKSRARPIFFWGTLAAVIILSGLIIYGYHWYKHLPKPQLITAHITAPKITPLGEELIPDTLTVDFGIENNGFNTQPVAPIDLVNKEVPPGLNIKKANISLEPAMPGKWFWASDSQLVFTPDKDWPAGQEYTIHFEKSAFAPQAKMQKFNYSFSTEPFKADINEFKFYQDPENAQIHEAVATLKFNYPVDASSLQNKITLELQALKRAKLNAQHFKFTLDYDKHKRTAYLHSENLALSDVKRYLLLTLQKGLKALSGTATTESDTAKKLLIPDVGSFFKIERAGADVVRNQQDRPEQVLNIETSLGATEAELNKAVHVFLLPRDYPATANEQAQQNYRWENPGEVTADILKLSTPLALQSIPADRDYATLHSYKFTAPPSRYLYLKIDKGIRGFGNFVLTNDYSDVVKIPEFPKEIGFIHKGSLLALSGEKKLSVVARGIPAIKFEIARVLPDDVNHLMTQSWGSFDNPKFINSSFNQYNISQLFSEVRQFDVTDLTKQQYIALDFNKYLASPSNTGGPRGLFLLTAQGWDPSKKYLLNVKSQRLILITDLTMLAKNNFDGSHDLFIQSIASGKPVANVKVSVLGKNGLSLITRTTDAQGHASFPTLADFTDEREPVVYVANVGNDVGFLPYSNYYNLQLNFSRFDVGGIVSNNQELQTLSAYLFSDRGIYRPGDTAHIAAIVKRAYAQSQPAGLPLEVTVVDPKGKTVKDLKTTLDTIGYLTFDFGTDVTSPTGLYTINLYTIKDNRPSNLLGSTNIRVAEFLPDRMRISAHLSTEQTKGWVSPAGLTAKVGLWNLYGAPAANRKIAGKIVLAPQRIQFSEYPDYTFFDPLLDPKKPLKTFTDTLQETRTNDQGQAEFKLNLEQYDKATYKLTFFAEGFESEGGRSVATQTTALVSPLDYFIGYKADGDLSYIKQNSQRSVNFIAVNPQLQQQSADHLKIQLLSLRPVTTLVKNPDGTYKYQSLIQTSVVKTDNFAITDKGTQYALPTQQIGDFAVVISDDKKTELTRFNYSVVGAGQLPLAKNAELSVKLNKPQYLPDEDIELQITAPYTGSGLITIERDKVYAYQWFQTNTTSSVQKIRLPKDFQGDGYVNVAFVRDWNSPEIFVSPLSYSVMPFKVSHESHTVHIDLQTPALARPGDPFTINYKSDKPSKIIVYAVDAGILQAADYRTPDPLGFFFNKRALGVTTQQIMNQILPKFMAERELSAAGGDHGEEGRLNLNPFKRKTELPVVYWSGIVDSDNTPRQLVYNIPDYFNGELQVFAVAVASDAIGVATRSSQVRGDFVINPNTPTFVAPNDEFEITASIANNVKNSGENAPVTAQLSTTPQLEIVESNTQQLKISEGKEGTVRYKLRTKSSLGSADMVFSAATGDKISKMTATLSVRPASPLVTTVLSGVTSDASKSINVNRQLYPEYRTVEASASTNPLILVFGLQRYLNNFPYGCTEQLASRAFPLLAMANQPWFSMDRAAITNKVQNAIQMVGQRQMASGGINYWPGVVSTSSDPFATVYALHFLTDARSLGFDVPSDILRSGMSYLKDLVSEEINDLDSARIHAYAIYVLTRNEMVTTNYLTNLQLYLEQSNFDWKNDITTAYMAATYQMLKVQNDALKFINYYNPQTTQPQVSDFYNKNIADAQYLYLVARHFPDLLPRVSANLVMRLVSAANSDEISTLLSSYTSIALAAYGQAQQVSTPATISINEILADGSKKALAAANGSYINVDIDNLAKQISFNNSTQQQYFYQLTQAGFDKNLPDTAITQGLEINRQYLDANNGHEIKNVRLGDEILVNIRVRALANNYLSNIIILDLLPGGFEVVRESVKMKDIDYADSREDRVIFFTSVGPETKLITYRIKATNRGKYSVPPVFANSMYNPALSARSTGGGIEIGD